MPIRYIVSDWNGTIIEYPTEGKLWETVGLEIWKKQLPFHPIRFGELFLDMLHLKEMNKSYKRGEIDYSEIYDYYNAHVLKGTPEDVFLDALKKYVKKAVGALDKDLLAAIDKRHADSRTGILSTGYIKSIEDVLFESGFFEAFDITVGNGIVWNHSKTGPRADRFYLEVYKNKEKFLEDRFFRKQGFRPEETAYIGDSDEDWKCLEAVRYPVVSRLATDEFKERAASKLKARVPDSITGYEKILPMN